ncbi:extracellular solute-binding protein family 5 [Cellulomonas flavigena DSM 20109]|uniref:Extracellular solute-binding protein family 5 n=1 Tax=Cellulomonas flavigena (strain ATCC 482 / DSM 20109 / BCRC 11376 / JCM 18109 / NBRC 3775 / NCIMB 8073 / NRS 134) TaxID=446466 RepID=D5UE25_CELFN|nr:ABC transporter substrate-binding protein [Cellulomonas flavigena]ADG76501.1 extracellular solute-binding protein family 5 [Cellulomonas flavigena DSM 20109]
MQATTTLADPATTTRDARDLDAIITYHGTEPENALIPGHTTESGGVKVIAALFRGLVSYDPVDAHPRNAVAESIESDDSRVFTIRLRRDWTFHDGTPVTAHSFVDAWNHTAYGPNRMLGSTFHAHIDGFAEVNAPDSTVTAMSGLTVLDDHTFTVTLSAPFAEFPVTLGCSAFFPLPASFFTDREGFEAHPIGNGAFRFVSRRPEINILLHRYEGYAGDDRPQIGGVEFKIYASLDDAYHDVVADRLDYLDVTPYWSLQDDRYLRDLPGRTHDRTYLGIQTISFPLYDARYADARVRQAISMSIDREQLVETIFRGHQLPADGLVPPAVSGRIEGQGGQLCTYSPARAKELFDAAGFEGDIELTSNVDSPNRPWMEEICASVEEVLGVRCRFLAIPTMGEFRRRLNALEVTAMFRSGWIADYPSIENFLSPMFRTGATDNVGRYSNPAVDALLDAADSAPTQEEAWARYQEAERAILHDMPTIPIWHQSTLSAWSTRLRDVQPNPFRELDLSSVTVTSAPTS